MAVEFRAFGRIKMTDRNLSIIIVNYNNFELTINLVKNLLEKKVDAEIVIVDNASTNNSYNEIENKCKDFRNVHLIETEKNLGYSGGNNFGIKFIVNKFSSIKYICIMNPDIEIISEKMFENLVAVLETQEQVAAVTAMTVLNNKFMTRNPCAFRYNNSFKILFQNIKFFNKLLNDTYKEYECNENLISYVYKLQGCFFVIKREVFETIGLFDENVFLYFEEEILAKKIEQLGMKCAVLVSEVIKHNHEKKDKEIMDYKARKFHNKVLLESKKYYMQKYMKCSKVIWVLSYIFDSGSRKIMDIFYYIKSRK